MTSFIHSDFPTTHAGVARIEAAFATARALAARARGTRGLVALLLAGGFSALVVVADQVVSSWADGQIVLAWIGLWVVLCTALLLFAEASRGWADRITGRLEAWSRARTLRREEQQIWAFALADPRFMAELQAARCHAETAAEQAGAAPPAWPFGGSR